jgi:actin-related protein
VDGAVLGHAAVRVGLGGEGGEGAYALPDGNVIDIGGEGGSAAEVLFGGDTDKPGIGSAVSTAMGKCDRHVIRDVVGNVVFSGRNTRFPGFEPRLERELRSLFPGWNGCVRPPVDPDHSAWVAGSMLASLSTFRAMTITYAEYDETGPTMVHRKCF